MLRRPKLLPLALLALGAAGCRTTASDPPEVEYPPVESASFGTMRNVSSAGTIWFGAPPGDGDLELAQRRGVRAVIDLTTPDEAPAIDAAAICERLGIAYYHPEVRSGAEPGDALVDEVVDELASERDEPRLVYCGSGGRCAMLVAIYRAARLDVPLEYALVEARRAGMRPQDEAFVREQVARLRGEPAPVRATEDADGRASEEDAQDADDSSASAAEASAKRPFVSWEPAAYERERASDAGSGS